MVRVHVEKVMVSAVNQLNAEERYRRQIERTCERSDQIGFLRRFIFKELKVHIGMRKDLLHRFSIHHQELRPQDLVSVDQGLQGIFQRIRIHFSFDPVAFRHVIEDPVRVKLADEVGPLLRRRHRIVFFFFGLRDRRICIFSFAIYDLCQLFRCRPAENIL